MIEKTYSQLMGELQTHLVLKLDTKEPIEMSAFVGAFTSLANEFDRHIKEDHPDLESNAQIYVRQVREGSIIADMLPWLIPLTPIINDMDKVLIVEEFVRRYGRNLGAFITGNRAEQTFSKSELKDWSDAVQAIANDPDGEATIEAATYEDGKRQVRAAFKFDTKGAKAARKSIEDRKRELDRKENADYERVLMIFTRSDVNDSDIGKRSGERVKIEEISDKPLALMYGSKLAEDRIKHEIRDADENVYKRGFVVDVNVQLRNGKPVAYSVTNLHDVLDLPDD